MYAMKEHSTSCITVNWIKQESGEYVKAWAHVYKIFNTRTYPSLGGKERRLPQMLGGSCRMDSSGGGGGGGRLKSSY